MIEDNYIYIKNWRIVWCSEDWTLTLWTPIKVTIPWYYRYEDWKLIYIDTIEKLQASDVFVWRRDFSGLNKARGQQIIQNSVWIDLKEVWWLEEAEKILEEWDTSWNIFIKEDK